MKNLFFAYDYNIDSAINSVSNGIDKNTYLDIKKQVYSVSYMENFPEIFPVNRTLFKLTDTLPANAKYVYNIPVKNISGYFIPKFSKGIKIPDKVLTDAKENNALICIDYHAEGHLYESGYLPEFVNIVKTIEVPKSNLILVHGDLNSKNYSNYNFNYIGVPIQCTWLYHEINEPIRYEKNSKLFLSYNRMIHGRIHRILLLSYLNKNNLLNRGIISIGDTSGLNYNFISKNTEDLSENDFNFISLLNNSSPDVENLSAFNPADNLVISHYEQSFLSLVSETLCDDKSLFFSEKIFKPLIIGHPFILNGNPYALKKLHELGFKTFEKYWDESYDNEFNLSFRIKIIVNNIKYLSSLNENELELMRQDMLPILTHNQKIFKELRNYYSNFVTNDINTLL